jgi:hypothetical protein
MKSATIFTPYKMALGLSNQGLQKGWIIEHARGDEKCVEP